MQMDSYLDTASWIWTSDAFGLNPSSYSIAIGLFTRLLGLIYLIAYIPFLFQICGLIGKDGILPITSYLEFIKSRAGNKRFYYVPTLLWLHASDKALLFLIWSGIVLGVLLMCGVFPPIILLLLYLTHLSLTSAGQDFLSFGWETFLMEMTVCLILLQTTHPFNGFGWICLNFLLLRFHVMAGASKLLSRDKAWANLTALSYHYLTQPLPNTAAYYFHKLPSWFHKVSAFLMFYIELIVPLAIISPPEIRLFVFVQLVALQIGIWFTGNLSYLNYLTVVICTILLHNRYLEPIFGPQIATTPSSEIWYMIVSTLGAFLLFLQVTSFLYPFFRWSFTRRILNAVNSFHIAYPHGIFAVMTTKRYEIVVEGSHDGQEWQEYHFFFKPGDLSHRPKRVAPYQPRLDWQAWFLPFASFHSEHWFQQFLLKLLEGKPEVIKLLKHNPFKEKPPLYVRALIYDYEFTTCQEKAETGNWWKRKLMGQFSPLLQLGNRHKNSPWA